MTSHSKPGWRRLNSKTHGTFETIPSLRVPGKNLHSGRGMSRRAPAPPKTPHYPDPNLFPGRRLDRRHQSTNSVVSGYSGLSGVDQITLPSSGRVQAPPSQAGSARHSHTSLPTVGANNNRAFMPDNNDPCEPGRQSPLTLHRRQAAAANNKVDLKIRSAPPLPPQSTFSKVSRWQMANFKEGAQRHKQGFMETQEALVESPDSTETRESEPQPVVNQELLREQEQRQLEPPMPELEVFDHTWGIYSPRFSKPTPSQPHQQQQQQPSAKHVNPHRRPALTPAGSPTPTPGPGPRLNKILWALMPDEHANASEAGASQMQSSCRGTSAEHRPPRALHKTVTVTDLDVGSDIVCSVVPETPRNPHLTEKLLLHHNESGPLSRDDRIYQWLAECEQETTSQSLPSHLPDIKYTFKYLKSAT